MIRERDIDALARTLWAEARGEGLTGMEAVACVIINRHIVSIQENGFWWSENKDEIPDNTIEAVCRDPWQFSCWNKNDPNLPKLLSLTPDDKLFAAALKIAEEAVDGNIPDITGGATHYYNPKAVDKRPEWAVGNPICVIGKHHFYRPSEVPKLKRKEEPCSTLSPPIKKISQPSSAVSSSSPRPWPISFLKRLFSGK
jgi:N-acetylmuramoyl-L-alanine amidase